MSTVTSVETVSYPDDVKAILARAASPGGFEAFRRQVQAAGNCAHPVRLRGRSETVDASTGEITTAFDSETLPDGVVLKACGNRRATRCLTCADAYRQDARQLVAAGLQGGKGVPASVACNPSLFLTLTGPSFGAVHCANGKVACHPGSPTRHCQHGRPQSCFLRHHEQEEIVGSPLCPDCYRYERHILWNALAPELWRRTGIYLRRKIAQVAGIGKAELDSSLTISFVKVIEYQRRGAVHVHAVIRADGAGSPVPSWLTPAVLLVAIRAAVAAVYVEFPTSAGERIAPRARWGELMDVSVIDGEKAARRASRYAAKYVSKSTDVAGVLDRRISPHDLEGLEDKGLSDHHRRLVECAWRLGGDKELTHLRLRSWAHQLGYRGHCLSKSRSYSTTFAALRRARAEHRARQAPEVGTGPPPAGLVIKRWRFCGSGYKNAGDALLASAWAESAIEQRLAAHGIPSPFEPPEQQDQDDIPLALESR